MRSAQALVPTAGSSPLRFMVAWDAASRQCVYFSLDHRSFLADLLPRTLGQRFVHWHKHRPAVLIGNDNRVSAQGLA